MVAILPMKQSIGSAVVILIGNVVAGRDMRLVVHVKGGVVFMPRSLIHRLPRGVEIEQIFQVLAIAQVLHQEPTEIKRGHRCRVEQEVVIVT